MRPSRPGCHASTAGSHFEHGDKDARAAGASVGKNAWAKALTYFNGTAVVPTTEPATTVAPTTTEAPTSTTG